MENDTKSKLIEIATPLFATKGFVAVSVRELTINAKINLSAISYYFNGKEGLYQVVLEEQLAPIQEALRVARGQSLLSPLERLTFYADQIARIHAQRPFLARFMMNEVTNPTVHGGPIIEKHISQVYQFMSETLQEGINKGQFREDLNITYASVSLTGILNFYFITKPLIQKFIELPQDGNSAYTAQAFHIYLHGIIQREPGK